MFGIVLLMLTTYVVMAHVYHLDVDGVVLVDVVLLVGLPPIESTVEVSRDL
jgi:hypothetical protein